VFSTAAIVLSVRTSKSSRWNKKSLQLAGVILGATSAAILWGWVVVAPKHYAPTLWPSLSETFGFALAGGIQSWLIRPRRS
jgi:hypothetical protein